MSSRPTARPSRPGRLRDEKGMTVIEVTVAAFLLVTAVVGTFGVIDTSTRSTFRAEETQTVINIAQRELEELRKIPYDELAMTAMPTPPYGTDLSDPTARIRTSNQFCLERVDGDDPCTTHPLVVNGGGLEPGGTISGGQVEPLTPNVEVGDITVDIHRFVVWQDEGDELLPPSDALCLDKSDHYLCRTQDYKRVAVAVKAREAPVSHERPYEDVQSDFIDPDRATLDAAPLGPGGDIVTGQQFWLSDTQCDSGTADPVRAVPTNHPTRDTLGNSCSPGSRPDALLTDPPLDPDVADPLNPAFFDYSTDLEPAGCTGDDCNPDDKGLQMLEQGTTCSPSPTGVDASKQIHRWVSRPIATGPDFQMTGKATLELWTRTINDVQGATGQVCAFLFKRDVTGADTTLDTASHTSSNWPSGPDAWSQVRLQFDLESLERTLLPSERLGVSIGVDPSGTPDNVLQFLYDHPEGESRLEVLTTTPLP